MPRARSSRSRSLKGPQCWESPPGDAHQRVAALARGRPGDRPGLADSRRLIASRRQAGEGVEALGGGEALDRRGVDGEGRSPRCRDPRQRRQDLAGRLGQELGDLGLDRIDVDLQGVSAPDVAPQALGPQLRVRRRGQAAAPALRPELRRGAREPPRRPGDQRAGSGRAAAEVDRASQHRLAGGRLQAQHPTVARWG